MKILVLGGGAQGRVVAHDLARARASDTITVADLRDPGFTAPSNLRWEPADLADAGALARIIAGHDLVVGALPSHLGYAAMRAAIDAGRNMVDVSFCEEDSLALDADARRAGVSIVPDCGLAPGLSHLCVGRAAAEGRADEVIIDVGGVAEDPSRPYGYVVTWSLPDLEQEYLRPARIVREGRARSVPAFSELVVEEIPGVGRMEAFLTDGLRTLVDTLTDVPSMVERTLRWPGHVAAVRPLLEQGRLVEELRARCSESPPRDLVVLRVRVRHDARWSERRLIERYDPASRLTAMARTTALTTAVCAGLAAESRLAGPGVHPLERVGRDERTFDAILEGLAGRGVRFAANGD